MRLFIIRAGYAIAAVLLCRGALACDSLSDVENVACNVWAPMTGDVVEDECTAASLDIERLYDAIHALDRPRRAGAPIWSRAFLQDEIKKERRRVVGCRSQRAKLEP